MRNLVNRMDHQITHFPEISNAFNANSSPKEPIAIIGMGGRFPGGANTPAEFWHVLREGVVYTDIPPSRWDWASYKGMIPNTGGFLHRADQFNAQ